MLKILAATLISLLTLRDVSAAPPPKDTVFKVQVSYGNKRASGSAFATRKDSKFMVVTATHVVSLNKDYEASVSGTNYPRSVTLKFAIVDGDVSSAEVAELPDGWAWIEKDAAPKKGDPCGAWGFPMGGSMEGTPGVVADAVDKDLAVRIGMPPGRYLHISGVVISGMSGGPIVNAEGKVFGIVSHRSVVLDEGGREMPPSYYGAVIP